MQAVFFAHFLPALRGNLGGQRRFGCQPLDRLQQFIAIGIIKQMPAMLELLVYFCDARAVGHHGAAASHLNGGDTNLVDAVCRDYKTADITEKLKALIAIAEQVQIDGKRVTKQLVDEARQQGATDLDIHDTVLIAAAFCMYNRYVDGLQTWQPRDTEMYAAMGQRIAEEGYVSRSGPISLEQ